MSDSEIDELFGEGGGAPAPRTGLVAGLLGMGLVTAVLGLACSAAPGAGLVLLGWYVVEKDVARVESGYLAPSAAPTVRVLRGAALASVLAVIALFFVQGALLQVGAYDGPWSAVVGWIEQVRPRLPPPPDAPAAPGPGSPGAPGAPPSGPTLQPPLVIPPDPLDPGAPPATP